MGSDVIIRDEVLVYWMGGYYTEWGVSVRDGMLVCGMGF